jgi:cellulose 1,4-beta-cellobiosidase
MSSGSSLKLKFVTHGPYSTNIGSRLYLLDSESEYKIFKLKNKEFTFDVDVSQLPCGLNGALYFVEMDADGGMSKYSGNKAGAKFGTGYCDAQCPHDLKFINGEGNCEGWKPSSTDKNSGTGKYGTCCTEMDIWESNSFSTAYTPHACTVQGQTRCEGATCGDTDAGQRHTGVCDKDGCDFNPYRLGDKNFFGPNPNFTVNSASPFTVVTQFITSDGTDNGDLSEIRRIWVQNGKVIQSSNVSVGGQTYNSISDNFCNAQKQAFGDPNDYEKRGGNKAMGQALDRGMVLVMSLWDDHEVNMLWLDSNYPPTKPATAPGVARGTCSTSSGKPSDVESQHPDASVTYSNIKYGELDSTYQK